MMYSGLVDTIIHLIALGIGVGFVVQAGLVFRQSVWMTTPDADRSTDITSGDTVAIEGIVQATQDGTGCLQTLRAPLSGRECVFAAWCVEEFYGHELATQSGWTEQVSGYDAEVFELTDGSGTIAVDVSGDWDFLDTEFDLEELDSPRQAVSIDDDIPPAIREFETAKDIEERTPAVIDVPTTESGPKQGDRRYYEATIAPGDSVFASGVAKEGDGETDVVVSDGPDHQLFISDQGQEGATKNRLFGVVVLATVGIGILWYAVAPLL